MRQFCRRPTAWGGGIAGDVIPKSTHGFETPASRKRGRCDWRKPTGPRCCPACRRASTRSAAGPSTRKGRLNRCRAHSRNRATRRLNRLSFKRSDVAAHFQRAIAYFVSDPQPSTNHVSSTTTLHRPRSSPRLPRGIVDRADGGAGAGYAQANLVILPADWAFDFLLFCQRNPKPCPLLDVTEPGRWSPPFGSARRFAFRSAEVSRLERWRTRRRAGRHSPATGATISSAF